MLKDHDSAEPAEGFRNKSHDRICPQASVTRPKYWWEAGLRHSRSVSVNLPNSKRSSFGLPVDSSQGTFSFRLTIRTIVVVFLNLRRSVCKVARSVSWESPVMKVRQPELPVWQILVLVVSPV